MRTEQELAKMADVAVEYERILRVTFNEVGRRSEEVLQTARMIDRTVRALLAPWPKERFHVLLDMRLLDFSAVHIDQEARQVYIRLFSHSQIDKVATVSTEPFVALQVVYYAKVRGLEEKRRCTTTIEEARAWLLTEI